MIGIFFITIVTLLLAPTIPLSPGWAGLPRDAAFLPQPPTVASLPPYTIIPTAGGVQVCGEIDADAVWAAATGVYIVTCDVHVRAGVTLRLEPGVAVKFQHATDDLIISGTLNAVGTDAAPIVFQPAAGTEPGSWGRVAFLPGSSGVLDHVRLEYGGHEDGLLYLSSERVQVLNAVVRDSADTGIVIQTAAQPIEPASARADWGAPPTVPLAAGPRNELSRVFLPLIAVAGAGTPSGPVIRDTQILNNTGIYGGGLYNEAGNPTIQGNTFAGNVGKGIPWTLPALGAGLYNRSGSPLIRDNTFTGNGLHGFYASGGGLYNEAGSPLIEHNIFSGNVAGYRTSGGGLHNASGSPTIVNNTFAGNYAEQDGGGMLNQSGSPIIRGNRFTDNAASGRTAYGYGGGLCSHAGSPIIDGNLFARNAIAGMYGPGRGGGVYDAGANTLIQNNVFWGNTARGPGGGLFTFGDATIRNNTFSGNTIDSTFFAGGGLASGSGAPMIANNIFAHNVAPRDGGLSVEGGSPIADHNAWWHNSGGAYGGISAGPHDLAVDPRFVDAATGDFHLAAGSPLIDAGDPAACAPTDFDGEGRPQGAGVDIGADEFPAVDWVTYIDSEHGLAFEYPAGYEQDPMAGWGCGVRAETLPDGRPIHFFGSESSLVVTPASGISLEAYVAQFIQQFSADQYPRRDDQRLRTHEPAGIVVEAMVMHHWNISVFYRYGDTIYELHTRPSLACSDPEAGLINPDPFWHTVESLRVTM